MNQSSAKGKKETGRGRWGYEAEYPAERDVHHCRGGNADPLSIIVVGVAVSNRLGRSS